MTRSGHQSTTSYRMEASSKDKIGLTVTNTLCSFLLITALRNFKKFYFLKWLFRR